MIDLLESAHEFELSLMEHGGGDQKPHGRRTGLGKIKKGIMKFAKKRTKKVVKGYRETAAMSKAESKALAGADRAYKRAGGGKAGERAYWEHMEGRYAKRGRSKNEN